MENKESDKINVIKHYDRIYSRLIDLCIIFIIISYLIAT